MKDSQIAKTWIASFLVLSILILAALSGIAYAVDPYFQYRVKDNEYFLSAPYVNAGLIENYDYDTLIIGSCMIGNFDMDRFRNEMNLKPVKIENGAMGPNAIATFQNHASKIGRAKNYFINIDLTSYQSDEDGVLNEHLMKDDLLSTLRYLLGYETWFRFIPVDCGLMLYKAWKGEFPPGKFTQRTSIDQNGAWNLDEQFGRDVVIDNRLANRYEVSAVNLTNLHERMIAQIDEFLSDIDFSSSSFTFIFPPYSTLYWCDTQDQGYFDTFLTAKRYFIQELLDRNCTVYDFHSAQWANDLDNFQDSTHYSPDVNDWMFDCFLSGDYMVTPENYDTLEANLIANTQAFRAENAALFN